jgi:flagellar biosynthesis/type III secretory pathway chaperone
MASLMENLYTVLEKENSEYENLIELSYDKTQTIIDGNIPGLEKITNKEQEIASIIKNLENKRLEIINDMAIVLSKNPQELTVTNMIAFLNNQPEEQEQLEEMRLKLKDTLKRMADINKRNEILLKQSLEMVEFDLTLLKSLRQAPTTANYNKNAYNTGSILGDTGFDAKQ